MINPDFVMTMVEMRTLRTVIQTLVDRHILPSKQHQIMSGLLIKMDKVNSGESN